MGSDLFYLTMIISIIIVIMVLQTSYLYMKLQRSRNTRAFLFLQGTFLLWTVVRLSEAYAPTKPLLEGNHRFQYLCMIILLLILCSMLFSKDKTIQLRYQAMLTLMVSALLVLITQWFKREKVLYYFVPILSAALFNLMLWLRERKKASFTGNLSLKTAIENIGDCILVLDMKQRIKDVNYSFFEETFCIEKPGTYEDFCNRLVADGIVDWENSYSLRELILSQEEREISIRLSNEKLTCICKATPLRDKRENIIGTVISFHDITGYRNLVLELEAKKSELNEIQDKLRDYVQVVYRLEEAKEKREIFLRIQSSIGQEIMELLTVLEVAQLKADRVSIHELELAVEACRSIIGRVRSSVSELERSKIND